MTAQHARTIKPFIPVTPNRRPTGEPYSMTELVRMDEHRRILIEADDRWYSQLTAHSRKARTVKEAGWQELPMGGMWVKNLLGPYATIDAYWHHVRSDWMFGQMERGG